MSPPNSPFELAELQERHLCAVPFENLDIHLGRPLSLDEDDLYDKIVSRRRGGFCYEVNGLFARLLRELGYEVTLLSCRVYSKDGTLGPEHDHLALLVQCQGRWLVDVGFGEAFPRPLDFGQSEPQVHRGKAYRLIRREETLVYAEEQKDSSWVDQYTFTLVPRTLETFEDMCLYHQTSPDSHFTQKRVCTHLTANGRTTIGERAMIRTVNGERIESPITDEAEFRAVLREQFGIALD